MIGTGDHECAFAHDIMKGSTFHRSIDMGLLHTMEQPHILVTQGKYKLKIIYN
jgi:hypothetical protein